MARYSPEDTRTLRALKPDERIALRKKFRELMTKAGIDSYKEIIKDVGISSAALSSIFSGGFGPHPKTAAALCVVLEIEPKEFYTILHLEHSPRVEEAEQWWFKEQQERPGHYYFPEQKMLQMDSLYTRLLGKIQESYEQGDVITKAKIVGGLEVIIRYSPTK